MERLRVVPGRYLTLDGWVVQRRFLLFFWRTCRWTFPGNVKGDIRFFLHYENAYRFKEEEEAKLEQGR